MSMKKTESRLTVIVIMTLCIATVFAMISCDGTMPSAYEQDNVVLQAYLYAGEPVNDIRLWRLGKMKKDTAVKLTRYKRDGSRVLGLDTIDTMIQIYARRLIDNAQVTISCNGISHSLALNESGSYEDLSGSLDILPGTTYRIDAVIDDRHVWANTTVPRNVGGLKLSRDTLRKCTVGVIGNMGEYDPFDPNSEPPLPTPDSLSTMTVKWNNPTSDLYQFRIMHYSKEPIVKYPGFNIPEIGNPTDVPMTEPQWMNQLSFFTRSDSVRIVAADFNGGLSYWNTDSLGHMISQPGRYKIIICSTTPDYQSMAWSGSTNLELWPRAPTNINNGVGYFSSFSSDSVHFDVVSPTEE